MAGRQRPPESAAAPLQRTTCSTKRDCTESETPATAARPPAVRYPKPLVLGPQTRTLDAVWGNRQKLQRKGSGIWQAQPASHLSKQPQRQDFGKHGRRCIPLALLHCAALSHHILCLRACLMQPPVVAPQRRSYCLTKGRTERCNPDLESLTRAPSTGTGATPGCGPVASPLHDAPPISPTKKIPGLRVRCQEER